MSTPSSVNNYFLLTLLVYHTLLRSASSYCFPWKSYQIHCIRLLAHRSPGGTRTHTSYHKAIFSYVDLAAENDS